MWWHLIPRLATVLTGLEAVMNLLRNGLLMPKTGDRWRTELTEKFAFLCGFSAEFITRSREAALCGRTHPRGVIGRLCVHKKGWSRSWPGDA
jgi:hypothetical protein